VLGFRPHRNMRLPDRRTAAGCSWAVSRTGAMDLHSHFRRFGKVTDVSRRPPSLLCIRPVQPSHRGGLCPHHVINGRQVLYRRSDVLTTMKKTSLLNKLENTVPSWTRRWSLSLRLGYISEDGKEFLVRWPPLQGDGRSCQGMQYFTGL
jgi:hypothetical protein